MPVLPIAGAQLVAGFHVHLTKPVEPDELLAVIASLGRIAPGAM